MLEQDGNVEELYDRWAASYDADANATRDAAGAVLRQHAQLFADRDVLELGCGTGRNTAWLAVRARRVTGLDFSQGMLRQAQAYVRAANVHFVRHDLAAPLPFADASWDAVAIVLVLEHLAGVAGPIAAAARVLRPGGALLICEYHPCRQLAGKQARFRAGGDPEEIRIPAYVHLVRDYVDAALSSGLSLSGMDEVSDPSDEAGAPPRVLAMWFRKE